MSVCVRAWVGSVLLTWPVSAQAAPLQGEAADGGGATPVITAARVQRAPVVDGEILGEDVWQAARPVATFWQVQPDEGETASERTEVRIVYTETTLFVGVVCFDRAPGAIIVSDSRRDSPLDETDSFQIIFDTFRDRLNGFVFGTNPAGIEYDGQVTNEGQGGGGLGGGMRQQAGTGSGFTLRMRAGESLITGLAYQRNDVSLPWGAFTTNLVRTRPSYSFTTRAFLQGLVQYNDRADLWSINLRVGWLQAANTGLFVVYTDTRGLYDLGERPLRTDRSFVIKFSRMFDVLR